MTNLPLEVLLSYYRCPSHGLTPKIFEDNLNFKGRDFASRKKVTFLRDVEITKVNTCAPTCPNGGRKMTFVLYEKGPLIENEVFFWMQIS